VDDGYLASNEARLNNGTRGNRKSNPTSSAGEEPQLDSLLKKLRDVRIATLDMKKGWAGMQEVLQSVFEGDLKESRSLMVYLIK